MGTYSRYLCLRFALLLFLLPQAPFMPHPAPMPTPFRGWKSTKLESSNLAFRFIHFIPEGLSESVMTTKAADLRDSPKRRKGTDVQRHIAEHSASNSWESDRLGSGGPPHRAHTGT